MHGYLSAKTIGSYIDGSSNRLQGTLNTLSPRIERERKTERKKDVSRVEMYDRKQRRELTNAFACIKVSVYLASAKYNNLMIFMRHRGEKFFCEFIISRTNYYTHKLCTSQMHLLTSMRSMFINTLHNYAKHIVFDQFRQSIMYLISERVNRLYQL